MKKINNERIIKILSPYLDNIEELKKKPNDNLENYGLTSITFIHIIVDLEKEFACEIPDEYLFISNMNTISKIISVIKGCKKT